MTSSYGLKVIEVKRADADELLSACATNAPILILTARFRQIKVLEGGRRRQGDLTRPSRSGLRFLGFRRARLPRAAATFSVNRKWRRARFYYMKELLCVCTHTLTLERPSSIFFIIYIFFSPVYRPILASIGRIQPIGRCQCVPLRDASEERRWKIEMQTMTSKPWPTQLCLYHWVVLGIAIGNLINIPDRGLYTSS